MRQLKDKTNLLVLLLTIFSLSFCTALDEATTTEDSASVGTGGASNLSADCTAASATSVYTIFSDINGAQDVGDGATWAPTYGGQYPSDTGVVLDDGTGPKCGNVAAKITRETTSSGWLAGGVDLGADTDWNSYDTLKIWVKADPGAYTTNGLGFKIKYGDSNTESHVSNVDHYGFTANGEWQLVKIPLADFNAAMDKTKIKELIWVGNTLASSNVVFFDEMYVDASGETSASLTGNTPTFGSGDLVLYSDASGGTAVGNNRYPGWPNQEYPVEITMASGNKALKTEFGQSDTYSPYNLSSAIDITGKTLYIDVYSLSASTIQLKVESTGQPALVTKAVTANSMSTVTVADTEFTAVNGSLDRENINNFFVQGDAYTTYIVDNIYFK